MTLLLGVNVIDRVTHCWGIYNDNLKKILTMTGFYAGLILVSSVSLYIFTFGLQFSFVFSTDSWMFWAVVAVFILIMIVYLLVLSVFSVGFLPAMAEIMVGGEGGIEGLLRVVREDWKPLIITSLLAMLVLLPFYIIIFGILISILIIIPIVGCLIFMIGYLILIIISGVVGIVVTFAMITVRLERNSPIDALRRGYDLLKNNIPDVVIGILIVQAVSMLVAFIPLVGTIVSILLIQPIWIFYLTSILLEDAEWKNRQAGIVDVDANIVV